MEPILFGNSFNEFEVLSIHSGLYTDILERQKNIMQHALQRHNKVMQIRFDLHYPANASISPSPDDISTFSYNFSRRLKRMCICSHRVDPHYIWVRELKESEYPHYHFMVWINASAIQNRYTIFDIATDVWSNVLQTDQKGLVFFCLNGKRNSRYDNGIIMNKNAEDFEYARKIAFRAGSYLAKVDSKDSLNKFERKYNSSRIS